jgi:hypothetical protein
MELSIPLSKQNERSGRFYKGLRKAILSRAGAASRVGREAHICDSESVDLLHLLDPLLPPIRILQVIDPVWFVVNFNRGTVY